MAKFIVVELGSVLAFAGNAPEANTEMAKLIERSGDSERAFVIATVVPGLSRRVKITRAKTATPFDPDDEGEGR